METNYSITTAPLAEAPLARLDCALWNTTPPETQFQCSYAPNEAFYVRMVCHEREPRITQTEADSFIHHDSCMEFFFRPAEDDRYLNLEANARGTMKCAIGSARQGRSFLANLPVVRPLCEAIVSPDQWELRFTITQQTLSALYPEFRLVPGAVLYANFYKCGDKTEQPHFGAWQHIDLPEPDFHCPAFFGRMLFV